MRLCYIFSLSDAFIFIPIQSAFLFLFFYGSTRNITFHSRWWLQLEKSKRWSNSIQHRLQFGGSPSPTFIWTAPGFKLIKLNESRLNDPFSLMAASYRLIVHNIKRYNRRWTALISLSRAVLHVAHNNWNFTPRPIAGKQPSNSAFSNAFFLSRIGYRHMNAMSLRLYQNHFRSPPSFNAIVGAIFRPMAFIASVVNNLFGFNQRDWDSIPIVLTAISSKVTFIVGLIWMGTAQPAHGRFLFYFISFFFIYFFFLIKRMAIQFTRY